MQAACAVEGCCQVNNRTFHRLQTYRKLRRSSTNAGQSRLGARTEDCPGRGWERRKKSTCSEPSSLDCRDLYKRIRTFWRNGGVYVHGGVVS